MSIFKTCIHVLLIILLLTQYVESQSERCGFNINQNVKHTYNEILKQVNVSDIHYRNTFKIPIVFHIVWNNPKENISDELIHSQLKALNRDFKASNNDLAKIPSEFKSAAGSLEIEFCIANINPFGDRKIGIIRQRTGNTNIGNSQDLYYDSKGGSTAWDTDRYLNIWVANTIDGISGFASYPGQSLPQETGIVINPKFIGVTNKGKFGLGRTLVHEMGHFFGLLHLWGEDHDCSTDDGIEDTPVQKMAYTGCPSFPQSGCSESEMFMNYMDYVDDSCMVFFTKGQYDFMRTTIEQYRKGLISNNNLVCSNNTNTVSFSQPYPNPSNGVFYIPIDNSITDLNLVSYSIFNTTGNRILTNKILTGSQIEIDISHYPNGIYVLMLNNQYFKLVKL